MSKVMSLREEIRADLDADPSLGPILIAAILAVALLIGVCFLLLVEDAPAWGGLAVSAVCSAILTLLARAWRLGSPCTSAI